MGLITGVAWDRFERQIEETKELFSWYDEKG